VCSSDLNKKDLKQVWNSVWEKELTELEVQQRYFKKLEKELKGEDKYHLMSALKTIENLALEENFVEYMPSRDFNKPMEDKENIEFHTDKTILKR
jgi:hypothetical protein